jgi:hypothetical protein
MERSHEKKRDKNMKAIVRRKEPAGCMPTAYDEVLSVDISDKGGRNFIIRTAGRDYSYPFSGFTYEIVDEE